MSKIKQKLLFHLYELIIENSLLYTNQKAKKGQMEIGSNT